MSIELKRAPSAIGVLLLALILATASCASDSTPQPRSDGPVSTIGTSTPQPPEDTVPPSETGLAEDDQRACVLVPDDLVQALGVSTAAVSSYAQTTNDYFAEGFAEGADFTIHLCSYEASGYTGVLAGETLRDQRVSIAVQIVEGPAVTPWFDHFRADRDPDVSGLGEDAYVRRNSVYVSAGAHLALAVSITYVTDDVADATAQLSAIARTVLERVQ